MFAGRARPVPTSLSTAGSVRFGELSVLATRAQFKSANQDLLLFTQGRSMVHSRPRFGRTLPQLGPSGHLPVPPYRSH